MNLATMTGREQVLVLITAAVLLGGAYGMLRYRPALKALDEMQTQTRQTEDRLKTATLPDAPDEDAESLAQRLAEADDKLAAARARIAELEKNLPPADAQEVKLKISELATAAGLLVRENEAYKPGAATVSIVGGGNARASRRAARAAARANAAAPAGKNAAAPAPATPGIGLEMLDRYAQPDYARPLQRVSLEGNYADIVYFIDELQKLPWQVTVAQVQIETDVRPVEPGMPQPLRASLILAL